MKTKQQLVSEFRRREIVDAARSVFARRGFSSGIMDEIAREAGLAKGTIYLYFKSKQELYKAVLHHDMEALKVDTLQRIDAAGGWREKIRAFALARLENADAKRELFRILDNESASAAFTRSQYRAWLKEPVLRLASAIEDAARRGDLRPVCPEKAAWAIADMTRGLIQRRLLGKGDAGRAADADFLLDFVWAALTARPGA
jgi:AcrR family transcriptional regulator